ncbi:hypothetical protein [Jannaschia formosa]|uniref:hypothetical protein n=1 Tax=Jannaschia formosa TaxID=2259592 RepID=UPI001FD74FEF|nr:hypothetical protein [Jannaschia formosa]
MASRRLSVRPSRAASAAQRRAWRRERLRDAARLLPVLGLGLMLLPDLVLSGSDAARGATRPWGLYLFAAWGGLILLAVWLARALAAEPAEVPSAGPGDPPPDGLPHDGPRHDGPPEP